MSASANGPPRAMKPGSRGSASYRRRTRSSPPPTRRSAGSSRRSIEPTPRTGQRAAVAAGVDPLIGRIRSRLKLLVRTAWVYSAAGPSAACAILGTGARVVGSSAAVWTARAWKTHTLASAMVSFPAAAVRSLSRGVRPPIAGYPPSPSSTAWSSARVVVRVGPRADRSAASAALRNAEKDRGTRLRLPRASVDPSFRSC